MDRNDRHIKSNPTILATNRGRDSSINPLPAEEPTPKVNQETKHSDSTAIQSAACRIVDLIEHETERVCRPEEAFAIEAVLQSAAMVVNRIRDGLERIKELTTHPEANLEVGIALALSELRSAEAALVELLSIHDVESFSAIHGDPFDARLHSRITTTAAITQDPALGGRIAETRQPGYARGARTILKPSVVLFSYEPGCQNQGAQ